MTGTGSGESSLAGHVQVPDRWIDPGPSVNIASIEPPPDPVLRVPDVAPRPSVALTPLGRSRLAVPCAVGLPMVQLPGLKSISPSSSVPEAEPDQGTTST